MSEDKDFLRRWSRLKRESAAAAAQPPAPEPAAAAQPTLPAIDSLTFESDFKDFMHSKVEEGVKRAALKKLFSDPRFNVMDGLDTYIDDYTKADPIPDALLSQLDHARQTLLGPRQEEEGEGKKAEEQGRPDDPRPTQDDDPGQDPQAV